MPQDIRSIVRKMLMEKYAIDGSRSVYASNGQGEFPYEGASLAKVPQDIDPVAEYVFDWKRISDNNDVYEFPTTEFNLGLKIEQQRNDKLDILTIAGKVIDKLKEDAQFYTKIREKNVFRDRHLNI